MTSTTPHQSTPTAPAPTDDEALAAARSLAPLVSPQDAASHLASGGLLLDVRSAAGRATTGSIEGARITDRADLGPELDPAATLPVSLDTPIVVVCGSERGSGPVAAELIARGYTDVRQVEGGAPGWAAAGLPLTS
ncbi:rhodanese-like domain-containing protein [Sanguibacter inulinus]|uniref:Sulfurtransferase n=1 Tax=Sanguibacter inulinus TaxID=60922 RepID=A0A853EVF4_9MICO|nr:rhodanese-like domain-containing protein [Sanguibacter inulinus]MBF0723430.1 sulfurtransferase [Sanguibacter inulinus]NYS94575.1 sulfurtransferase [Sanguibacter inulinus]